ncbi:MAG: hypothetical protein FP827_06665 [Candidatus Omnitrophica bacterium]|nr:hypothetical protein [Candidatus Omnitrophota bacterium]
MMISKMPERRGTYFYMFPEITQARKAIWDGMDYDGFPFIQHFPKDYIKKKNESEMKITTKDGSIFQLGGSDNYNSYMGTNPIGMGFSEFSLQDPAAWDYFRPILRENKGWAAFIYTFRGKNHGFDLYEMAKDNPEWFCEVSTINDTRLPNGLPVISQADIQKERDEGMSEDLIQQEYFCNPESGMLGSYYSDVIKTAREDNRICSVPYQAGFPVHTHWDIGKKDHMAIIFSQKIGKEIHLIDCLSGGGSSINDFVRLLQQKPYIYGAHFMPHDADPTQIATGTSLKSIAEDAGLKNVLIVPKLGIDVGINAMRQLFNQFWIDDKNCKPMLEAWLQYHKHYDAKRKDFMPIPHKDWSEHYSDSGRYLAVAYRFMTIDTAQSYEVDTEYQPGIARRRGEGV